MKEKIKGIRSLIVEPPLKTLFDAVCEDHIEALCTQPAGCSRHHAYEGGLLDHLHDTAQLAWKMGRHFNDMGRGHKLNVDLIVLGAFLHDIGKVACYKKEKGRYIPTRKSTWHHHIPIGYHIVAGYTDKMVENGKMGERLADKLLHIIISHHGRVEYRSNVAPRTDEAFIVSQADLLDAFMGSTEGNKRTFNKKAK